jgi:type I restriction enzyme M protein
MNLSSTIKSIQDIMRKDDGVDGDAQRLGQLTWMLFLKVFDQREEEWEDDADNKAKIQVAHARALPLAQLGQIHPMPKARKKPQIAGQRADQLRQQRAVPRAQGADRRQPEPAAQGHQAASLKTPTTT